MLKNQKTVIIDANNPKSSVQEDIQVLYKGIDISARITALKLVILENEEYLTTEQRDKIKELLSELEKDSKNTIKYIFLQ